MDIGSTIQQAENILAAGLPILESVVTAINPAAGTALVAIDKYLPQVEPLTTTAQQLVARINAIRAQAGVPEAVWNDIADANVAADAKLGM